MSYDVIIYFANGSRDMYNFPTAWRAQEFAANNISYTGGKVSRVEIAELGTTHRLSTRAVWDATWDAISQLQGLGRIHCR